MTLILELPPEVEQQLEARAKAEGQDVQTYAVNLLANDVAGSATTQTAVTRLSDRQQAVLRACGMFKSDGRVVDRFLHEQHEESEREFR